MPLDSAVTGYRVYKSMDDSDAGMISSLNGDIELFIDGDVQPNHTYRYYITAMNTAGEGEKSETVSIELTSADTDQGNKRTDPMIIWSLLAALFMILVICIILLAKQTDRIDHYESTDLEEVTDWGEE